MITSKMLHNANKLGYVVQQYPEKSLADMLAMFQMPAIDINTALWVAIELGFVTEPDKETGTIAIKNAPEVWELGDDITDLQEAILYSFHQLALKEQDLEENYMSNWTAGYPAHDVIIALKQLKQDKLITTYELTDPKDLESTYTFFTLYENGEQMWGKKQFAVEPDGTEVPVEPTLPGEE